MLTTPHALRFPGTLAGFEGAARELRELLEAQQLDEATRYNVELVFEEIGTNIVRHGRPAGDVEVTLSFDGDVVLRFEDDGEPFDPRTQPAVPAAESLEEARVGGLGLVQVGKMCSRIEYSRTPTNRNQLTLVVPAS